MASQNLDLTGNTLMVDGVTGSGGNLSGVKNITQTGTFVTSVADALTAHAGGGQGSALALTASINRITTVATAADSVVLPASVAGLEITVINAAAANSMNVFPASGDAINALTANTALAVAANKTISFYCTSAGRWHGLLSA